MRQSRAPHDFREACNEVSAATRYGPHTTDAASGGAPPLASLQKPVNAQNSIQRERAQITPRLPVPATGT